MRIVLGASGTTSGVPTFTYWWSQKEKRKQEIGNLLEKIMIENFPNLVKETDIQVQEVQRVPNKMNPKRPHQDTSYLK